MCVFETCQALRETQTQNVADTTQRNSHSRSEKNDSLAREGYSSCHQELQGEVFPGVSDSQPLKIMKTHGFTSGVCWLGVVDRLLDILMGSMLPYIAYISYFWILWLTDQIRIRSGTSRPATFIGKNYNFSIFSECAARIMARVSLEVTKKTESAWWFQPLWKIWKSVVHLIPNIWKNNPNVPNHQPGINQWIGWNLHNNYMGCQPGRRHHGLSR